MSAPVSAEPTDIDFFDWKATTSLVLFAIAFVQTLGVFLCKVFRQNRNSWEDHTIGHMAGALYVSFFVSGDLLLMRGAEMHCYHSTVITLLGVLGVGSASFLLWALTHIHDSMEIEREGRTGAAWNKFMSLSTPFVDVLTIFVGQALLLIVYGRHILSIAAENDAKRSTWEKPNFETFLWSIPIQMVIAFPGETCGNHFMAELTYWRFLFTCKADGHAEKPKLQVQFGAGTKGSCPPLLLYPSLYIRMAMSFLINHFARLFVTFSIPLLLMQCELDIEFVEKCMLPVFILKLDDISHTEISATKTEDIEGEPVQAPV